MRIPFTTVEAVWHRVGEPVDGLDAGGHGLAHRLLPVKVRSVEDEAVARRLRGQCAERALRSHQRIVQGQWCGPWVTQRHTTQVRDEVARASQETLRLVRLALYDRRFDALKSDNKRRVGEAPPGHSGRRVRPPRLSRQRAHPQRGAFRKHLAHSRAQLRRLGGSRPGHARAPSSAPPHLFPDVGRTACAGSRRLLDAGDRVTSDGVLAGASPGL